MNYWTNHDLSTSAQSPKRVRSTLAIVDVGNFVVGSKLKGVYIWINISQANHYHKQKYTEAFSLKMHNSRRFSFTLSSTMQFS
jgi:hypothetical protein